MTRLWAPLFIGSLLAGLLAGCASGPTGSGSGQRIHFVENRSVDLAVRRDFDEALQMLEQERYEDAIKLLEKVVEGSQNNSAPYINMAMAYEKLGKTEKAEDSFKHALTINPDHPVANNEYALLLRKTGRYSEAKQLYENVLKRYPEFMPARRNLGILCDLYLDDAKCALSQYQIYSKAHPEDKEVELWIVGLKTKLGK
jgi:Tfp pilus assembly protein PilF